MLNLATILESSARQHPDRIATFFKGNQLTYQMLNGAANQVAAGLAQAGIQKGDKVALSCPNLPYFPIVYYGILKAGATVVPLNVLLKPREIAYHLKDSDAKAYFCFEGTPELPMGRFGHEAFKEVEGCTVFRMITADPAAPSAIEGVATLGELMAGNKPVFETVQTSPEDTAVILYTSGTTGRPKGAELTHTNLLIDAIAIRDLLHLTPDDVQLVVLPLFHSFGQTVQMNAGLLSGGKLALLPRFDPEAAYAVMQSEDVTVFCGVPTMYWQLLELQGAESRFDLVKIKNTLRICASGGASLPVEIIRQFEAKFDVAILEGYGLSETAPVSTFNNLEYVRKPGSIGKPIWGVELMIVDKNDQKVPPGEVGELLIKGPNVMKGYYNRREATEQAFKKGWFHTGDMARVDEDGFYYIVDRVKDMIIRGGYNVYPREIEEVLLSHPAVSMAAVIGVPHDTHGEEIKALVIPTETAKNEITPETLIEWAKEQVAAYKYPRIVEFVDSFPMTATGKILKRELKN